MTTTSVKSVGNVMNLGPVPAGNAAKTADDSFQAVWNSRSDQSGSNGVKPENAQKTETSGKAQNKTSRTDASKDGLKKNVSERKNFGSGEVSAEQTRELGAAKQPDAELSDEDLERAMEVIATAAAELIQQIADTFQIPVPDVQELMTEMGLQPADLLQSESLSSLLLEVGGAEDSLALLTDEQLYGNFQALMEQRRELAEQSAQSLGMTPEELEQTIGAAMAEPVEEMAQEPLQALEKEPDIRVEIHRDEAKQDGVPEQISGAVQDQTAEGVNAKGTTEGQTQGKRHDRERASHGQSAETPFLQNVRDGEFRPETQSVQETTSPWDADTQNIMRQIMDYMRIQVRPNVTSLEMQLHPASLGTLQVQVASKGGVLTANFVTQNEAVKAALESQMVQLKESFEQQGVKVEAIEVTVQTHQFEENLEQGRGRQPEGQDDKKGRGRRANLQISGDAGGAEGAEGAAAVPANGSTVDFTA